MILLTHFRDYWRMSQQFEACSPLQQEIYVLTVVMPAIERETDPLLIRQMEKIVARVPALQSA